MRSRFSIFSFETLRLGGFRPRGLLVAIGLLLVVELFVARRPWVWTYVERSETGLVDVLESRVIEPVERPSVVLFGNSRLRDGVLPRRLEERLGLEPGTALNLGLSAGAPYDYLLLYERNRDRLSRADRLVVAVDDFRFNELLGPGERFHRHAGLKERIGAYRGRTASLVLGWFWRTFDARYAMLRSAKAFLFRRPRNLPIPEDGRIGREEREGDGPPAIDADAEVRLRYGAFEPSEKRVESVRSLLRAATEDGVLVCLIQLPSRDAFVESVDRLAPEAPRYHAEVFERLARAFPGVRYRVYRHASALGIAETDFYDYGHLTTPGARVFTDSLADWLAAEDLPERGRRSG